MRKLKYKEIRQKFNEFNDAVFLGLLRKPLFSIQASTEPDEDLGHCCAGIFLTWSNSPKTMIILNPAIASSLDWEEVLLHEMFHLYNYQMYGDMDVNRVF